MKKDFFTDGEKIRCFDEICACFYEKNFGRLSKADMDMMMFRFYLQKMVDASKEKEGGLIDYRKCSDIKMAKELGITPARVWSLKTRVQFASPIAYDWKRQFALLTPNADYDPASMTVSLHVPDPSLFIEIKSYVEDKGGYVEIQLNGSLLRLKAPYFLELLTEVEDGGIPRDELEKAIRRAYAGSRLEDLKYDPLKLGKFLADGLVDFTQILKNLREILSPAASLGRLFLDRISGFLPKDDA